MEFKVAKCPNCGGDLQVPENMGTVKCMYCGSDIVVREAINLANAQVNLDNIFKLAETARSAGNSKEAYDYYTKILEYEPNNWRAWYGKALSAAWQTTLKDSRLDEAFKLLETAVECAPESEVAQLKKDIASELNKVGVAFYSHVQKSFSLEEKWARKAYITHSMTAMMIFIKSLGYDMNPEYARNAVKVHADNTSVHGHALGVELVLLGNEAITIMEYGVQIADGVLKLHDPSYKTIQEQRKEQEQQNENIRVEAEKKEKKAAESCKKQGGCFIATAVYSSYDAPEVLILRNFRDAYLEKSVMGRMFIKTYYKVSPPIADWIRDKKTIKRYVKALLDRLVNNLR